MTKGAWRHGQGVMRGQEHVWEDEVPSSKMCVWATVSPRQGNLPWRVMRALERITQPQLAHRFARRPGSARAKGDNLVLGHVLGRC